MIDIKAVQETDKTNKFTVSPVDQETKQRFLKFRVEDVRDQFIYACLFQTVTLVWRIIMVIDGLSHSFYGLLTFQSSVVGLYWTLFLLRNRWKEKFMVPLVGLQVLYYLLICATNEFIEKNEENDDHGLWGRVLMLLTVSTNLMLLTPSLSHACFIYVPLHLLTYILLTIRHAFEISHLT